MLFFVFVFFLFFFLHCDHDAVSNCILAAGKPECVSARFARKPARDNVSNPRISHDCRVCFAGCPVTARDPREAWPCTVRLQRFNNHGMALTGISQCSRPDHRPRPSRHIYWIGYWPIPLALSSYSKLGRCRRGSARCLREGALWNWPIAVLHLHYG